MSIDMNFNFFKKKSPKEEVVKVETIELNNPEKVEISDAEKSKSLSENCIENYQKEKGLEVSLLTKIAVENALTRALIKGFIRPDSTEEVTKFVYDKIESIANDPGLVNQRPVGRAKVTDYSGNVSETSLIGKTEYGADKNAQ